MLIGGEGEDGLGGGGGFSYGGIDGLFGFGLTFTPIVINVAASKDDDNRDDLISITAAMATTNALQGTGLADFLVGNNTASVVGGREGNDFLYGDTPTDYLSGTYNIGNTLTNPTFDSSGSDGLISGGFGDDSIWAGVGADTHYGDVSSDNSGFDFSLDLVVNGADALFGGARNDTLSGGGGADMLKGEARRYFYYWR